MNRPRALRDVSTEHPKQGRAIVLVFGDDGQLSMQATPDVTVSDYVLGAFNLTRHANRLVDGASTSPIVMPEPGQPV